MACENLELGETVGVERSRRDQQRLNLESKDQLAREITTQRKYKKLQNELNSKTLASCAQKFQTFLSNCADRNQD